MSYQLLSLATTALGLFTTSFAQYPPPAEYTNVLRSPLDPRITLSYKTPSIGTCATVFSTQRQFTGYITLPPNVAANQNYTINTFFWFVEARQKPETAPLTVWLQGGPGSSSLIGLFNENGPCEVVETANGDYGTQTRLWGWDRSSNMLYIDQPVQVGLSYDILTNASLDLMQGRFSIPPTQNQGSGPSYTFLNGTFSSQNTYATANTSQIAAQAVWHFLQTFLQAFPEYNPGVQPNDPNATAPTGVHLFTESYGGTYGPVFADHFEAQNDLLRIGQLPAQNTLEIDLATVGVVNGLVDWRVQAPYLPIFASNNTYGIKAIDATAANNALSSMRAAGGCLDQLDQCRNLASTQDAAGSGAVKLVNDLCAAAFKNCALYQNLLSTSGRSVYDIRQKDPSPFPSSAFVEYLNTPQVQRAIGTPINYTGSNIVDDAFYSTGDPLRGTQLAALGRLLGRGIHVALIYGDADFICNWLGGEAISLSLATMLPAYSIPFPNAGYAGIVVNDTYVGGSVRQFGNLSFSRIFDAGHLVPAYQPETAFTVFTRIIQGTSIAMGQSISSTNYSTTGRQFSANRNKATTSQDPECWIRDIISTCTPEQRTQMLAGNGIVRAGVYYATEGDVKPMGSSVQAGSPGSPAPNATMGMSGSQSVVATGVYTATGTPKASTARRNEGLGSAALGLVLTALAFHLVWLF